MLGKLVNKFKKQSLQDQEGDEEMCEGARHAASDPPQPLAGGKKTASSPNVGAAQRVATRKSARLNPDFSASSTSPNLNVEEHPRQSRPKEDETVLVTTFDSGTESDDDELEQLESMSSASQNVFEFQEVNEKFDAIGSSPPTLTSSPPLISEIDTSSWDSLGQESGIVLRESAERDDASRNVDLLEDAAVTPTQRKDGFPANFEGGRAIATHGSDENSPCGTPSHGALFTNFAPRLPIDFSALRSHNVFDERPSVQKTRPFGEAFDEYEMESSVITPLGSQKSSTASLSSMLHNIPTVLTSNDDESGAFRPVKRHARRNSNNPSAPNAGAKEINESGSILSPNSLAVTTQRTNTPSPNNLIGEKRRWSGMPTSAVLTSASPPPAPPASPIASRTRGSLTTAANSNASALFTDVPRAVLTAARRTRVHVIYHDSHSTQQQLRMKQNQRQPVVLGESPPNQTSKRGRLASANAGVFTKSAERPSLNFDKMRERMMGLSAGAGGPNASSAASAGFSAVSSSARH